MRYEALFAAAFVAGLLGAMSQQGVAPQTRTLHMKEGAMTTASAAPAASMMMTLATPASDKPAADGAAPVTAKQVAAEAKPVKKVKMAKKAKAKSVEVAAAPPPPPPERHGFFYRLFHKSTESERVATAEPRS